jgi:putative SOS response-associated peptidase YedK
LVGQIHDRMPVILHRADYERWIATEPHPRDLLRPFEFWFACSDTFHRLDQDLVKNGGVVILWLVDPR